MNDQPIDNDPADPAVLRGDGRYGFTARVEGDDLVVRQVRATWFGGAHDPLDNGQTASGVSTRLHPGLLGCALPMGGFRLTRGSPLPDLPWMTTEVDIFRPSNNRRLTVPLIDLGPAAPPHAHAAIDLTMAAFRALGGDPEQGDMEVSFRIPGAARRLPAPILAAVRASRREASPTPRTAIGTASAGSGLRSSALTVVPPVTVHAAGAGAAAPAAGTAQSGTAAGSAGRAVPLPGIVAALAWCLFPSACAAPVPRAAWPETLSLMVSADHEDPVGWERQTVGLRLTWQMQPLSVDAPVCATQFPTHP